MAILKKSELKKMNKKQLQEKLNELNIELMKEKAASEIGASVSNPGRIKEIRRTIARIKSITKEGK
jgi:large subunit ribosomal protein L29